MCPPGEVPAHPAATCAGGGDISALPRVSEQWFPPHVFLMGPSLCPSPSHLFAPVLPAYHSLSFLPRIRQRRKSEWHSLTGRFSWVPQFLKNKIQPPSWHELSWGRHVSRGSPPPFPAQPPTFFLAAVSVTARSCHREPCTRLSRGTDTSPPPPRTPAGASALGADVLFFRGASWLPRRSPRHFLGDPTRPCVLLLLLTFSF